MSELAPHGRGLAQFAPAASFAKSLRGSTEDVVGGRQGKQDDKRGRGAAILLANPRGFCAGVERAIRIVELALERQLGPVYVRHEIVHNRAVVDRLRSLGARFVEELDQVPDGAVVIFSAHGVSEAVEADARVRGLRVVDATCPLVAKVHRAVAAHVAAGRHVALVGHSGHPEVDGTMGRAPLGAVTLVESEADLERLPTDTPLAYATQTTLSVEDASRLVKALASRRPDVVGPSRSDICYATTNRQSAVRLLAREVEAVLVVGSRNSSNSRRLVEVAEREGTPAQLVDSEVAIEWPALSGMRRVGVTAGASAPEESVRAVIAALRQRLGIAVAVELPGPAERATFPLPSELRDASVVRP